MNLEHLLNFVLVSRLFDIAGGKYQLLSVPSGWTFSYYFFRHTDWLSSKILCYYRPGTIACRYGRLSRNPAFHASTPHSLNAEFSLKQSLGILLGVLLLNQITTNSGLPRPNRSRAHKKIIIPHNYCISLPLYGKRSLVHSSDDA